MDKKHIILTILISLLSLQACKSNKSTIQDYLKDQVEVDLAGKTQAKRIIASFPNYGFRLMCNVDKLENKIVFSFNAQKFNLDEVIKFLSNEVGIESASKTTGCKNK